MFSLANAVDGVVSKGWTPERFDAEAGLQYLNARYYDPELAMFVQPDWWEVTEPGVGTNRYSYAGGDPVNGVDPSGHFCWRWGDSSPFCARSDHYHEIHLSINAGRDEKSYYFAGVSSMTANLSNMDKFFGDISGLDDNQRNYLNGLSEDLMKFNDTQAERATDGDYSELRGVELDKTLIRDEQNFLEQQMTKIKRDDPALYNIVISGMNENANMNPILSAGNTQFDPEIAVAASRARQYLNRGIDFGNLEDRVVTGEFMMMMESLSAYDGTYYEHILKEIEQ